MADQTPCLPKRGSRAGVLPEDTISKSHFSTFAPVDIRDGLVALTEGGTCRVRPRKASHDWVMTETRLARAGAYAARQGGLRRAALSRATPESGRGCSI